MNVYGQDMQACLSWSMARACVHRLSKLFQLLTVHDQLWDMFASKYDDVHNHPIHLELQSCPCSPLVDELLGGKWSVPEFCLHTFHPISQLFTLQHDISKNQLQEMEKYNVQLVVPKAYVRSFPEEFRENIWTLDSFVGHVLSTQ